MLSLCLFWLAANGFSASGNLEMYLDGQLLRREPNPSTGLIVQTGAVGRVELNIPDDNTVLGQPAGLFSFANDRASFAIHAATSHYTRTNTATLLWKKEFTKLAGNVPFTYTVNPSILYLVAPNADPTNYFLASWKLVVRVEGIEWMSSERVIEGFPRLTGPTAFGLTTNNGPIETLYWDVNTALHDAEYATRRYKGELDLRLMREGLPFTVEYEITTRLIDTLGAESLAEVYLGDPLKYGSGIQTSYGAFGELFFLTQLTLNTNRGAVMFIPNEPDFYFILCRKIGVEGPEIAVAMSLGTAGELVDPNPPALPSSVVLYSAKKVPLDQSLDSDGDGIRDGYELQHAGVLDPLDARDAGEDPDGDGYDNLAESTNGTDPATPDGPAIPRLRFPGLLVPSYPGGKLIDVNQDGLLDSASAGLNVALARAGGTFDAPVRSPLPGIRVVTDTAYLNLDGDAFPDAVVIDLLTNRVFTFRGVGDGTFTALTNDTAISSPNRILPCNLNGDALSDLAIFSQNGRGVDLHLNNGDGTLTRTTTVTTNAYGIGNSFAMADLNNDSRDDIIVGYAFNVVVFLSQPDGSYGPAHPYPVGSSPAAVAVGDLNHDGLPDIVAANSGSLDISVLIASAPGTFLPQVRYPVLFGPQLLSLVDLNGDTHLDAVLSRGNTDYQMVLPGLGNGLFGPLYSVPTGASLAAIHDWNGDGKLDLVSTAINVGGIVNFGLGDGTFDSRLQIVPTNPPPTLVTAVDLNGDGELELVGLNTQVNAVDIWEHAAVTGTNRLLGSFVVGPYATAYAPGDFNGDGRVDLAVTTQTNSFNPRGSNQVVILTNAGSFTFQDAGHYPLDVRPNGIVTGDFNGDGVIDLAVHIGGGTQNGGSQLVSMRGNGAGGFQLGAPVEVGATLSFMAPADADGDSRSELVLRGARISGAFSTDFLEVFALEAGGGWTNRQSLAFTNNLSSLQVLSVNGDAYPDLVAFQSEQFTGIKSLRLYPGGPAGFGPEQVLEDAVEFQSFSRLADLNGDGLLDVASFNALFLAKPGGGFHPVQNIYIGAGGVQDVADFNHDGKPDLLNGLSVLLQK